MSDKHSIAYMETLWIYMYILRRYGIADKILNMIKASTPTVNVVSESMA